MVRWSVGVLLMAAVAAGAGAGLSAGATRPRAEAPAALRKELSQLVAMPAGPPGVIVTVRRSGPLTVYRAGVADLRSRRAIGAFDQMRVASISKAFSGAVALALVDRHLLSLSDTIGKLLPQLPKAWRNVTLREVLNHTSGLPDYTASKAFGAYLAKHPLETPRPLFLLHFVARRRLEFVSGSKYRYSNTDNFVAALMAEAASHRSYNRLLSSYVFKPLHLTGTSLPDGTKMPRPYIHGYLPDPPNPPEDVSTLFSAAYAWASGGIVSTPHDLNRFIRGYVGARLFSRRTRRQQLQLIDGSSDPPGPGQNMAGLGIFRYGTRCGSLYGHTGNIPGYTQFMAATLDGKRSVTVSATTQLNDNTSGERLAAFRRLRQIEQDAACIALAR